MSRQQDNKSMELALNLLEQAQLDEAGNILDRPYEAHRMRLKGCTFKAIANALGYYDAQAASRAINDYYQTAAKARSHRRDQALQEAIDRVEMLMLPYMELGLRGDIDSAGFALKCIQELNKLQALYTEVTQQTTNVVVISGREEDYVADLKKLALETKRNGKAGTPVLVNDIQQETQITDETSGKGERE